MRLGARIVGLMLVGSLLAFPAPVRAQVCGDGVIDAGETCDPPNLAPNPVTGQTECRLDCTFCGDGVVQPNDVETCDLGSNAICSWCLQNCNERIFPSDGYGGCSCAFDTPALVDLRADILAACECGNASSRSAFVRCARAKIAAISPELILPPLPNYGAQMLGTVGVRNARGGHVLPHECQWAAALPDQARCCPLHGPPGWIGVARSERGLLRRVSVKVDGWSN